MGISSTHTQPTPPFALNSRISEARLKVIKRFSAESELFSEERTTDTITVIKTNRQKPAGHLITQSLVKPSSLQAFYSELPINFQSFAL